MLRYRYMESQYNEWSAVRIRTAIKDRISNFLETKRGKELGISNPSQFLDLVSREKLDKFEELESL